MGEFELHPLRGAVLGEIHARPFLPVPTPSRLLHFAFMTEGEAAVADRQRLAALCAGAGLPKPDPDAKHLSLTLPTARLRWEQHSEFTTYTWQVATRQVATRQVAARGRAPFDEPPPAWKELAPRLPPPGPLLVAADLHLLPDIAGLAFEDVFDPASLAASRVDDGGAVAATDFRQAPDGLVRLLVLDEGLGPGRAGALTQRLLEIETYRSLALLGLPEAQRLFPSVRRIEERLADIARTMTEVTGVAADSALLAEITGLAAELEAESAATSYRFGASRAYDRIVQQRLAAIGEEPVSGWPTLSAFLSRRMAPAMRTCTMLEERQADLSRKLTRAANLLRTRVDVEIERQNRDLLAAMNERTRLQLRLQQTVEGLSVAAISYYVVGLVGYLLKGAKEAGAPFDVSVATAIAVPLALGAVYQTVRRIRRKHVGD